MLRQLWVNLSHFVGSRFGVNIGLAELGPILDTRPSANLTNFVGLVLAPSWLNMLGIRLSANLSFTLSIDKLRWANIDTQQWPYRMSNIGSNLCQHSLV